LWKGNNPAEEHLIAGKVQNLRVAIRRLDALKSLPEVSSVSAQLGHTSKLKGYVEGESSDEGCIIPNIGGGLCQLSNALYDAAMRGGFEMSNDTLTRR